MLTRFAAPRPPLLGVALFALLAAGCRGEPAATSAPAGGTPAVAPARFGPEANATLAAVRDAPDVPHRCTTEARQALQALAEQYPLEVLVRQAARSIMPQCHDHASLAALLEAVPREARTRDEELDLIRLYLRKLSRFADAEAAVKPLVDADPDNTETLSLYAAALYYQGRFAEATALVDRRWTVLVSEGNTDIMTMRADQFMKDDRPDRAEAILRDVLERNPGHMFAMNTLRQVRALRGDAEGAAVLAATAEALDRQIGIRERAMAEAGERFQDLVAAFDAFDYATAEQIANELIADAADDSMRADLYTSLATIYLMQGRADEALEARDQATHFKQLADAAAGPIATPTRGAP